MNSVYTSQNKPLVRSIAIGIIGFVVGGGTVASFSELNGGDFSLVCQGLAFAWWEHKHSNDVMVVCAKRDIPAQTSITVDDLERDMKPKSEQHSPDVIKDIVVPLGRVSSRSVRKGQILTLPDFGLTYKPVATQ